MRFLTHYIGRFAVALLFGLVAIMSEFAAGQTEKPSGIRVVAAENTYGDLFSQIGGSHVRVLSILSDPNVDPHEYESNVSDARAIAEANIVIENSGDYDSWMDKLLAATPSSKRVVIKAFELAPTHLHANEHVWYNPDNVLVIARKILESLKAVDAADSQEFDSNFAAFTTAIQQIDSKIANLKTIFLYQSDLLGLNVLTPWDFEKAIAEGNDPVVTDLVTAEHQIFSRQVKLLVYNLQTVTPQTTRLENDAKSMNIPIVPVTETMPLNFGPETAGQSYGGATVVHYQTWMLRQLDLLEKALAQ
jgi:zinc/manganese transport system substrate-binding protein